MTAASGQVRDDRSDRRGLVQDNAEELRRQRRQEGEGAPVAMTALPSVHFRRWLRNTSACLGVYFYI